MSVLLGNTEQYGKHEGRKEELKYLNQLSHGWNTKRISEGWDWNSNEKNPSSIAMGLLTTVFLMGIMTGFLGTLLLQLIKLIPRGLLQPCNDYFFFPWESRKSDLKRIWWAFFSFSDVEGFEWKPELKPQTWVWEQSMRWEVTGTEGRAVLQERMDKIEYRHPSYQFVLLSYFFSVFLLLFASYP